MALRVMLVFAVVAIVNELAAAPLQLDERCSVGAQLTINMNDNASGHWRTSLNLKRELPTEYQGNNMTLNVHPKTTIKDGVRFDSLTVVMEGPNIANSFQSNCASSNFGIQPHEAAAKFPPRPTKTDGVSPLPPRYPGGESPPPPRPPGYVNLADFGYYKKHAEKLTWWEAQKVCLAEGAHLLSLDSQEEANAIRQFIMEPGQEMSEWLHVGVFSPNTNFVTIFGSPLSSVGFQKWAVNEPDLAVCGHVDRNMLYWDGLCSLNQTFICEYGEAPVLSQLLENLPPPPTSAGVIATPVTKPNGQYTFLMKQVREHYYMVHEYEVTWWKAKEICERERANLVVINSNEEADLLKNIIRGRNSYMHIGIHSVEYFVTIFGKPLSSAGYKHWESEQPDDERCVQIDANMLMYAGLCSFKAHFICEQVVA